ncbi:uncharacterized protein zgc:111983 [Triplophysa rosa]|uniref:uncharacterized protein zgc:111983 n=1 Tax=Triplophysa rosa TaxID=992332 RepID=UPI002545EAB6|nr:uncharacterized protein zgc:111983 [Triplophysa rosa]
MEWRIILPVVCVLGILLVPGSTATTATSTNATATTGTSTNATATTGTSTNATATTGTSTNATATTGTSTNATATTGTSTNATATTGTSTNATATTGTSTNATATTGTSTNATATTGTSTNATATTGTSTNATATTGTSTNATATTGTSTNATATTGTSTNATATTGTSTNATATTGTSTNATATSGTASNGMTPNPTASAVTEFNIIYSIDKPFKEVYSNLNASETITLKDNITSQIESVYKKRYTNFRRHIIRKFSNGSIVTDGALEFNASNSNPNVSELAKVLVDAITAGNLTIQIKNDSINVTAPATAAATTATPSTTFNTSQINVTFSITDNFTDALSNLSSPEAIKLAHNITTQFVTVFKRRYANMLRMVIRKFSKGSIVTDGALEFINNGTVPKAQEVVNFIVEAVKNGSFTVPIDEKTVTATDSSGVQATPSPPNGSSPVISSMFTVLWMALASLLLSGVMHQ